MAMACCLITTTKFDKSNEMILKYKYLICFMFNIFVVHVFRGIVIVLLAGGKGV